MRDATKVVIIGIAIAVLVPLVMLASGIIGINDPDQYSDETLKSLLYGDDSPNIKDIQINSSAPVVAQQPSPSNPPLSDIYKAGIFPDDSGLIYYSTENLPVIQNQSIPAEALKTAFRMWEEYNPGLNFTESDISNIHFKWLLNPPPEYVGLATCEQNFDGEITHCIIEISLGGTACNGIYVQARENDLANVIMHEIGHTLGLEHGLDESHLMHSLDSPQDPFDSLGYQVPEKLIDLNAMADLLEEKIEIEQERIEAGYSTVKRINEIISERNKLIEEINAISNEKTC